MEVIEHGTWQRYEPATRPAAAPPHALFARRDGDGVDWYDYVNAGTNFAADTLKITVVDDTVCAATYDATRLFPGAAPVGSEVGGSSLLTTVLEVRDPPVVNPYDMSRKVYDRDNKTFGDPKPLSFPGDA